MYVKTVTNIIHQYKEYIFEPFRLSMGNMPFIHIIPTFPTGITSNGFKSKSSIEYAMNL